MAVKITHIIIPLKNDEEIDKARDFFVKVLGFHMRNDSGHMDKGGAKDVLTEDGIRRPDRACHLVDDHDTFIDLVGYNNRPVCYTRGLGSGKGIAVAIGVDNVEETWAKMKELKDDYPVRPIFEPRPYAKEALDRMHKKEGHYSFISLDMGRVSDDGEEQILEIVDWKEKDK